MFIRVIWPEAQALSKNHLNHGKTASDATEYKCLKTVLIVYFMKNAINSITILKDVGKPLLEELKQKICIIDTELETLRSLAVQLGAEDVFQDLSCIVRIIEKALQEKIALDLKAKAIGYKSVDLALTALRESKAFDNVPSDFTTAPSHWLVSRSANKFDGNDAQSALTNSSVPTIQAQQQLRKLLPLIAEFCDGATEASVESLREGFFSLSYNSFSTELLKIIAKDRNKENETIHPYDNECCPPVGELILAYECECLPWLKSTDDFQQLVKFAMYPIRLDLVDQAAELDALNNFQNAEIATLLISISFFELASIDLEEVTGYELNHPDGLPTKGKPFLLRLKNNGLKESINDYQQIFSGLQPQ